MAKASKHLAAGWPANGAISTAETAPPEHGVGLWLPETPAELRRSAETWSCEQIANEYLPLVQAHWHGVTLQELRTALLARFRGTWRFWGKHSNGQPWPWQSLPTTPRTRPQKTEPQWRKLKPEYPKRRSRKRDLVAIAPVSHQTAVLPDAAAVLDLHRSAEFDAHAPSSNHCEVAT